MRAFISGSFSARPTSTPTRRSRSGCWPRAINGHAVAPPKSVMNSRRLIASPEASGQGIVQVQRGSLEEAANVRFGSKADICSAKGHVRFTPESDIGCVPFGCPLRVKSGHRAASFDHLVAATAEQSNQEFSRFGLGKRFAAQTGLDAFEKTLASGAAISGPRRSLRR